MKWNNGWASVAALGVCAVALLVQGCSDPPAPAKTTKSPDQVEEKDPLQVALGMFRAADGAAAYRDALRPLDPLLGGVQLAADERDLLVKRFHLDSGELAELEATFYRPLDAFHLEECFLLRDAARAVVQPGVPALRQAEICLDWVCRQVLLRETAANLVPPLFLLKQGHGSARERALVFLALLNQLRMPGCIVAWPEPAPGAARTVLAGVVAGGPEATALYLFDPRLGRPVPGPGGKPIATLADLRNQPALFPVAKEEATAGPEVLVACPLLALAPRMRFLERKLAVQEQVLLGIEPAKVLAQLERAAGEPAKVWNPPAMADQSACNSPTRMLRYFLAAADGGAGSGVHVQRLLRQINGADLVVRGLVSLHLAGPRAMLKAPDAQTRLQRIGLALFKPYGIDARNLVVRGQYEKAAKRLDMILSAYDDMEFSPLSQQVFQQELRQWCARADQAHLVQVRKLPKGQEMVDRLWMDDQYLLTLLEAQERPNPQKQKKTILTVTMLVLLKDGLGAEARFLQAQSWQERAERSWASWQKLVAAGNAAKAAEALRRAQDSWQNAAGLWRKCVERYSFEWSALPAWLKLTHDLAERNDIQEATSVWHSLLADVHRSAAARLNLARALELEGRKAEALHRLTELAENLVDFRGNAELRAEVADFSRRAAAARASHEFVDSMARELGPSGGLAAIVETAQRRIRQINGK